MSQADNADELAGDQAIDTEIPPKVSLLTATLCVLNVIMVGGFAYLLLLDYNVRQRWSYATFQIALALDGLPLEEESKSVTGMRTVQVPVSLNSEILRARALARGAKASNVQPVQEVLQHRITKEQLSEPLLRDAFAPVEGDASHSLEEEMSKAQARFFTDVEARAAETVKKHNTEAAKRARTRDLLLPLAAQGAQIVAGSKRIQQARSVELDSMLLDAVQRRFFYELLWPLDLFRPGDRKTPLLADIVDPVKVPLSQVQEAVQARFTEAVAGRSWDGLVREPFEKRLSCAVLLVTLGKLRDYEHKLLYPKGTERAETVVGVVEYIRALDALAMAYRKMRSEADSALRTDREGKIYDLGGGKYVRVDGFTGHQPAEVQKVLSSLSLVEAQKLLLAVAQEQLQGHELQVADRKKFQVEQLKRLLGAREQTQTMVEELTRLEQQLFSAQRELANVSAVNLGLEEDIRQLEKRLPGKRSLQP